jgi:GNAT superfamily N-acetyltransferase
MIRDFESKDTERVAEFHKRILNETGAYIPGHWDDDIYNIIDVYIRPGGCFILIEENNTILAMGAIKVISCEVAEIKRMRVETSLQRQGLGQKIYDYLISYAIKQGYKRIILDTTDLQEAAQNFYVKNGFTEYNRNKMKDFTLILYEKYL